jgi:hypothetical protein
VPGSDHSCDPDKLAVRTTDMRTRLNQGQDPNVLGLKKSAKPANVPAVADWPTPISVYKVRAFLGLANYFRKYIRAYSAIATPLADLLTGIDKQAQIRAYSVSDTVGNEKVRENPVHRPLSRRQIKRNPCGRSPLSRAAHKKEKRVRLVCRCRDECLRISFFVAEYDTGLDAFAWADCDAVRRDASPS